MDEQGNPQQPALLQRQGLVPDEPGMAAETMQQNLLRFVRL